MSQHDETELLERFRQRLSAIEADVPDPPVPDFRRLQRRSRTAAQPVGRLPSTVALLAAVAILAVVIGPLVWAPLSLMPGEGPSPTGGSPGPQSSLVAVTTQPPAEPSAPQECMEALVRGQLMAHPDWGIALARMGGPATVRVLWPHGFAGRWEAGRLALVDSSGRTLAHVGDEVELGGGLAGGSWLTCGEIRVVAPSPNPSPPPASAIPTPPTSPAPSPTSEPTGPLPEGGNIRSIPPGPLGSRAGHSAVWTGNEMIVWGGTPGNDNIPAADGAAYDPRTNEWRLIAASSLAARVGHTAIWTGTEMIVWGGTAGAEGSSSGARADGAAYDPATDTWRPITEAPAGRLVHSAVWTGTEMVVWGGADVSDGETSDGFAYEPLSDTWRELPPLPIAPRAGHSAVWTGERMIIWGGSGAGPANDFADGAIYNPADDSGVALGADDLGPRAGHSAVWTGERMIIWGGGRSRPRGGPPFADGRAYEPATERWRLINLVPAAGRFSHSTVWTGQEMLVFGGRLDTTGLPANDGFAYDPEALHDCADLVDLPPVSDDSNTDSANEVAEIVFTAEAANDQLVRISYTDPACRSHPFLGPYIEMLLEE